MAKGALPALCVVMLVTPLLGCQAFTDPLGRQYALEQSQKKYTELIRWGDIARASNYVEPELRGDFMALAPIFKNIRITDYEIGEIELEDKVAADLVVTYRGYLMPAFIEKTLVEHQSWRRTKGNTWRVTPQLAGLVDGLIGPTP